MTSTSNSNFNLVSIKLWSNISSHSPRSVATHFSQVCVPNIEVDFFNLLTGLPLSQFLDFHDNIFSTVIGEQSRCLLSERETTTPVVTVQLPIVLPILLSVSTIKMVRHTVAAAQVVVEVLEGTPIAATHPAVSLLAVPRHHRLSDLQVHLPKLSSRHWRFHKTRRR